MNSFGLPIGRKKNPRIPTQIFDCEKKNIQAAFLRGLVDTDFSISFSKRGKRKAYSDPTLTSTFSSQKLVEDCKKLIKLFDIKANIYSRITIFNGKKFVQYTISVYGKKNLDKWIVNIGFSNEKNITKVKLWKKQGFCPTKTTVSERRELLNMLSENSILPRQKTASVGHQSSLTVKV